MPSLRYAYNRISTGLRLGGPRLRAVLCLLLYMHHFSVAAAPGDTDTLQPVIDLPDTAAESV